MSMAMDRGIAGGEPKLHIGAKRSEIWICDISGAEGSVQSGNNRPCLILQNEIGNRFAPTIIVAPITSSTTKKKLPTHVTLKADENGLLRDSIVYLEQIRTIDQWCLINKVSTISSDSMFEVEKALLVSVGLPHLIDYHKR